MQKFNNIIIANYSINSLALICSIKHKLSNDLCVLSVDTGFAASKWDKYLNLVFNWLKNENIKYFHLKAENSFQEIVSVRKQFPSQKLSWCASFLKGITILNKINELDTDGSANILLSHRKDMSSISQILTNIDEEEMYDYRTLKYPILNYTDKDVINITKELPFKPVKHSFECQPCIYLTNEQFNQLSKEDIKKVTNLEKKIDKFMFKNTPFNQLNNIFPQKNILQELSKACSWQYSCGL